MKTYFFLFSILFSMNSYAAIWAKLGTERFNMSSRVHLIIAGVAHDGINVFQQVAIAKGLKYKENYPQDEVVFVFNNEVGLQENIAWLKERSLKILDYNNEPLTASYTLSVATYFTTIISVDIFSHSAIKYGIQLSVGPDGNIFPDDYAKIQRLKSSLMFGAYVVLHGCNSGFMMAPLFSDILGVPVFGSLTSTDFQEKLSSGDWYFNNPEDKPLDILNDSSEKCRLGLCIRMKPRNSTYQGYWGSFSGGGLSFYKAFCVNVSRYRCMAGFARYTQDFVSSIVINKASTLSAYKKAVQEILCPIHARSTIRQECIDNLTKAETDGKFRTYNPLRGTPLQCSMEKCRFEFFSTADEKNPNAIDLINTALSPSTTFVDEYMKYIEGYTYLKKLEWD